MVKSQGDFYLFDSDIFIAFFSSGGNCCCRLRHRRFLHSIHFGARNIFLSRLLCVSADYLILDAHCLTSFPHPDVRTLPLSLYVLIYTHLGVPVLLFGLVLVAGQTSFLLLFPWYYNIVVRDRHNIKAVHARVVQCVHYTFISVFLLGVVCAARHYYAEAGCHVATSGPVIMVDSFAPASDQFVAIQPTPNVFFFLSVFGRLSPFFSISLIYRYVCLDLLSFISIKEK